MKTVTAGEKLKAKRQKQIPLPCLESYLDVRPLLLNCGIQANRIISIFFFFLNEKIKEELVICLFGLRSNPLSFSCSVLQGIDHCKLHFPRFFENWLLIRACQ